MKNGDRTNLGTTGIGTTGIGSVNPMDKEVPATRLPVTGRSAEGCATTGHPAARVAAAEMPTAGRSEGRTADESATSEAEAERAWWAKYAPVERAIVEAHERRVESRRRNQRKTDEARRRAAGDLMEATEGFAAVWQREGWTFAEMVAWADGDAWTLLCLARFVRLAATRRLDRLRHAARRPSYYGAENARRRARAAGRRIRRRTTLNPCPTREQILDAWLRVGESHAATIRFGSLVADLECYLDNSLVFDGGGAIVGRRGGVKRWLQENIPALYLRYTTVMRYKAAAQKLRRIAGLDDPVPAAAVVEPPLEDTSVAEPPSDTTRNGQNVDVAGDGCVRLRCGRNSVLGKTTGNDGRVRWNLMCGDGTMEVGDRLGLRGGRNQPVGVLDGHDGTGGVNVCGGMGMDGRGGTGMGAYAAAIVRARAVWRDVVADVAGHGPTALVARIDACVLQGRPA